MSVFALESYNNNFSLRFFLFVIVVRRVDFHEHKGSYVIQDFNELQYSGLRGGFG